MVIMHITKKEKHTLSMIIQFEKCYFGVGLGFHSIYTLTDFNEIVKSDDDIGFLRPFN